MPPPPRFDFYWWRYTATVRSPFRCPCYSAPLDRGGRGGHQTGFSAGDTYEILEEVHQTADYVAVLTDYGWVNVWCQLNNRGQPTGVNFCSIDGQPK